jgi:hypothetical protein
MGINSDSYGQRKYTGDSLTSRDMLVGQGGSPVYHFKTMPAIGYNIGLHSAYYIKENKYFVETGINYVQRKYSSIKDITSYSEPGFENVNKSVYYIRGIEIPILIGVSFKSFSLLGGASFPITSFGSQHLEMIDGSKDNISHNPSFIIHEGIWLYPDINLNYKFVVSKINVAPYVAAGYTNRPYFHMGVIFGLQQN